MVVFLANREPPPLANPRRDLPAADDQGIAAVESGPSIRATPAPTKLNRGDFTIDITVNFFFQISILFNLVYNLELRSRLLSTRARSRKMSWQLRILNSNQPTISIEEQNRIDR